MKLLVEILSGFILKNKNVRDNYIFYKIIDSTLENEYFLLQCINKKSAFHAKIAEIVFDVDILYGLHPIQACYIGIEYSRDVKNSNSISKRNDDQIEKLNKYSVYRYGTYRLSFQNREGDICFINELTSEEFLMDPRDVALSKELIQEFDAAQAFYIGLLAGLKINNPTKNCNVVNKNQSRPNLRLIK